MLLRGILLLLRGIGLARLPLQADSLIVPANMLLLWATEQLLLSLLPLLRLIAAYQYASPGMLPVLRLAQVIGLYLIVEVVLVELSDFLRILEGLVALAAVLLLTLDVFLEEIR